MTRLDPMHEVLHYELLKVAHALMVKKQNKPYWDAVPKPKAPIGQIRHEVARQVATFAVPLAGLAWTGAAYGLTAVLLALPLAWLVGFLLDKNLESAISRKLRRDEQIDRGRYRATKWLSEQMGIRPEDITLPMLYKMAADFRAVDSRLCAEALRAEAARKAAIAASVRQRGYRDAEDDDDTSAGVSATRQHDYSEDEEEFDYYPAFNPATGLPMMGGNSSFDVGGHVYGCD